MHEWRKILLIEYECQQMLLTDEDDDHSNSFSLNIESGFSYLDNNCITLYR